LTTVKHKLPEQRNHVSGNKPPVSDVPVYTPEDNAPSRFNIWIRSVALLVLTIFIPDQVSWAFNYNPQVLWGDRAGVVRFVEPGMNPFRNLPRVKLADLLSYSIKSFI
jgi:hypothetical protein